VLYRSTLACVLAVAALAPLAAQVGPAQAPTGLSPEVLALACAPQPLPPGGLEAPLPGLRVTGGQDSHPRDVFVPGDLVTINAGENQGISIGQEYFVRRIQRPDGPITAMDPAIIRTAGWIRVWATDDDMSLVTVSHACDTLIAGDYLEPLALPTPVAPDATMADPERDNYARVLVGNDQRQAFANGDFFLIDRGSTGGVEMGSRFVLYRNRGIPDNFMFEIGEAIAVSIQPTQATLQMVTSRDALVTGDYVALRRDTDDQ
jgi:hypothetical protein